MPGIWTVTLVEPLLRALLFDERALAGALPVLALRKAEVEDPPFLALAPTRPPFWLPPFVPTEAVDRFFFELPAVTLARSEELAAWPFRWALRWPAIATPVPVATTSAATNTETGKRRLITAPFPWVAPQVLAEGNPREAPGAMSAESGIRGRGTGDPPSAVRARGQEAQERRGNTRSASSSRRPGGPASTMMTQVAPASARSRRCSDSPSADPHQDTESFTPFW